MGILKSIIKMCKANYASVAVSIGDLRLASIDVDILMQHITPKINVL